MGSCVSTDDDSLPSSPSSPSGGRKLRKNLKKPGSRSHSSFDFRGEVDLHSIPGRMVTNGASDVASMFTQQGKKGSNQDAMIVWENFGSRTDTVFCGIFDGHGPLGHFVARKVRDSLPLKLSAHWDINISTNGGNRDSTCNSTGSNSLEDTASLVMGKETRDVSMNTEDEAKHPEIYLTLRESFMKAFKVMDTELKLHPKLDCFCSGTTAVTLIKQGCDLVIANIGDSRAVLGTRGEDDSLIATQLTVDFKPNLPKEAERIRRCKGRIFALQDEPEVARVWMPNCNSPGLAMARAFGDFCLKNFGLISVPDVSYRRLTLKDEFIVIATDGIWDVLSNNEVVDIISSAPNHSAARILVESAIRAWRYKYPTSKVDDCAVVCLFFNEETIISTPQSPNMKFESVPPTPTESPRLAESEEDDGNGEDTLSQNQEENPDSDQENWTALEGVTRVNTLLTLPRFIPGLDSQKPKSLK